MRKTIQVIATFLVVILISGAFILWPKIEIYLFEEEEYVIIKKTDYSDAFSNFTDSISIFSEENWDKRRYGDLLENLDVHKAQELIIIDEYDLLKKNLEDAYTNTLKNSITNWTNNKCINDSIKIIKEEIFGIANTNLTYKGYLEKEIEIINTYNDITERFSNDIYSLTSGKYDTLKVKQYKTLVSRYKKNKHFSRCAKVINIVKDAEIKIQNYEMYSKEFNENIVYYIENYMQVCTKGHEAKYGTTCQEHILEYGTESHNTWKRDNEKLDTLHPYKFDYDSNGDPLSCYDFKDYLYYYNELKTKKICD